VQSKQPEVVHADLRGLDLPGNVDAGEIDRAVPISGDILERVHQLDVKRPTCGCALARSEWIVQRFPALGVLWET
jgi:hypothetical protein